jgi:hypothetical protein
MDDNKSSNTKVLLKKMVLAAKTNSRRIHIITRESNHWAVKKEGHTKASHIFKSKDEAIVAAQSMIKNGKGTKIVLHNSYGKTEPIGI